ELLHGAPQAAGGAGDRRVQEEGRARRPSVPATQRAPARLDRNARGDEPVHGGVQRHHGHEGGGQDRVTTSNTTYCLLVLLIPCKNPRDASLCVTSIPRVFTSSK